MRESSWWVRVCVTAFVGCLLVCVGVLINACKCVCLCVCVCVSLFVYELGVFACL